MRLLTGGACHMVGVKRDYQSLPEKAGGFTKRSYPEGHMVCCVALQTAPFNV